MVPFIQNPSSMQVRKIGVVIGDDRTAILCGEFENRAVTKPGKVSALRLGDRYCIDPPFAEANGNSATDVLVEQKAHFALYDLGRHEGLNLCWMILRVTECGVN